MTHRKLIAIDFDGVLHAYDTPFSDAATISDGPTPGAMAFLRSLVEDGRFDVCVVSSRCKEPSGVEAIQDWLHHHLAFDGVDEEGPIPRGVDLNDLRSIRAHIPAVQNLLGQVEIISYRPPAFLTIDDRGWQFTGTWPDLEDLAAFRPWNKRRDFLTAPIDAAGYVDFSKPSLTVMGTPTPADDMMIAAIAEGMAAGEAARTGQGSADPSVSLETARLIARRAFSAGVGRHGYCEYDSRSE